MLKISSVHQFESKDSNLKKISLYPYRWQKRDSNKCIKYALWIYGGGSLKKVDNHLHK